MFGSRLKSLPYRKMSRAENCIVAGLMVVTGKPSAGQIHIPIPARTIMGTTVRSITVIKVFIIITVEFPYAGLAPIEMAARVTTSVISYRQAARPVGWFLYNCHPTP